MNEATVMVSPEFRARVFDTIVEQYEQYQFIGKKKDDPLYGKQTAFSRRYKIDGSILNRILGGDRVSVLSDAKLLDIGQRLGVEMAKKTWKRAKTEIFERMEQEMLVCKTKSIMRCAIDECGIGKSYTAEVLSLNNDNVFHVKCKQSKSHGLLIRYIASLLGIKVKNYQELKEKLKYKLINIPFPLIILDDLGYVTDRAIQDVLELVEATKGRCGWYIIGDDSLESRFAAGVSCKKTGYRTLFSWLGSNYSSFVPKESEQELQAWYKRQAKALLMENEPRVELHNQMINQMFCDPKTKRTIVADLRRVEAVMKLYAE